MANNPSSVEHGWGGDVQDISRMFDKCWEYDPWADMKELKELYYAKSMPPLPYGDINDFAMEEELVSVAENGDQENSNAENGDQENNSGDQENNASVNVFDGAANELEISWDQENNNRVVVVGTTTTWEEDASVNVFDNDPCVAPQEYINEEQYKQFLINNNSNNVGEEKDASMAPPDYDYKDKNNNNNAHTAPKEYYINDDTFMAAPQQPKSLNVFPAGNVTTAAAATTSSTRASRVVWTDEEHKQFLIGLGVNYCNRGNWKRISAEFVPTKSPTQICSHAQKYFNRLDSIRLAAADTTTATNNRKRRRSIHGTTITGNVRVDEPFKDTNVVAALYDNKNENNGNNNNSNVAAPPEMDTDSDVEWLESMLEAPETTGLEMLEDTNVVPALYDNDNNGNNNSAATPEMDTELYLDPDTLEAVEVSPVEMESEHYLDLDLMEAAPLLQLQLAEDTIIANQLMVEVEPQQGGPQVMSQRPRWSDEEHIQFLIGLERYGKGKWKAISAELLTTKSPSQIASHAQKYFLRQDAGTRKRKSIHDLNNL